MSTRHVIKHTLINAHNTTTTTAAAAMTTNQPIEDGNGEARPTRARR